MSEFITISGGKLFDRVVSILEQAKSNVVKAVNSNMVIAYWLIGREIIEEIQRGEDRAEYGKKVVENLSIKLAKRYGRGFSANNIKYFRLFFQTYIDRAPVIGHLPSDQLPEMFCSDWLKNRRADPSGCGADGYVCAYV